METEDFYYDDGPDCAYETCPKCGRDYDEVGYEYQYCKKCGYDAELGKFGDAIEPTEDDYLAGEADILTGLWN